MALRASQQNLIINPRRISHLNYPALPATNKLSQENILCMSSAMEFSQLQETLDEMWEAWSKEEAKESVAILNSNQVPRVNNTLIFKFAIKKSIGSKDLEAALNAIWRPSAPVKIHAVGEGIFVAEFQNTVDCNKILAKQPWQLSSSLMVFKRINGEEKISEIQLNEVPFWVQIHGLEFQLMTRYAGEVLGSKIGKVLEIDGADNSTVWGKCLRVRVLVDITKSLARGSKVVFNGKSYVVVFRYEKLNEFCYVCGKLDHLERDCPMVFVEEGISIKDRRRYQSWLKADGFKGITMEDFSKNLGGKGKMREIMYDMENERQVLNEDRENMAIQLVNVESNLPMRQQGVQICLEPVGSRPTRSMNLGGIEGMIQGAAAGMGGLFGNPEFNNFEFGNAGVQMQGQFGNFNSGVDWANMQMWGGISMSMEVGANVGGTSFHQMNQMQNIMKNMEQVNRFIAESAQSNARGKDIEQEASISKGKKQTNLGKAKMMSVGNEEMYKKLYKKRGFEMMGDRFVMGKKLRRVEDEESEDMREVDEEVQMGEEVVASARNIDQANKSNEEAESGGGRLRQEK